MIRDDDINQKALARRAKIKTPAKAGTPVINTKFCKGCGLCINKCPSGALLFNNSPTNRWGVEVVVDSPDHCTGCQLCEMFCPDFAIFAYKTDKAAEKVV